MEEIPVKTVNWWQTLPGILTSIGGVIVAISSLIGVLYQAGLIDGKSQAPQATKPILEKQSALQTEPSALSLENSTHKLPATPPPSATTHPEVSSVTSASATDVKSLKPMSESVAIITTSAGEQVSLKANTFSAGGEKTKGLQLSSGQTVNFEKIKSIEFLGVERTEQFRSYEDSAGLPKIRITLWEGQTITSIMVDAFGHTPSFFLYGSSGLGDFQIRPWEVKEIRFER